MRYKKGVIGNEQAKVHSSAYVAFLNSTLLSRFVFLLILSLPLPPPPPSSLSLQTGHNEMMRNNNKRW